MLNPQHARKLFPLRFPFFSFLSFLFATIRWSRKLAARCFGRRCSTETRPRSTAGPSTKPCRSPRAKSLRPTRGCTCTTSKPRSKWGAPGRLDKEENTRYNGFNSRSSTCFCLLFSRLRCIRIEPKRDGIKFILWNFLNLFPD